MSEWLFQHSPLLFQCSEMFALAFRDCVNKGMVSTAGSFFQNVRQCVPMLASPVHATTQTRLTPMRSGQWEGPGLHLPGR